MMLRLFVTIYSPLCCSPSTDFNEASVNRLQDLYDGTMLPILTSTRLARAKARCPAMPSTAYAVFDNKGAAARRGATAFEHRYHRTHAHIYGP